MTEKNTEESFMKKWGEVFGILIAAGTLFGGGVWYGQQPTSEQIETQKAFIALDLPARIKESAEATNQLRSASQEFSTMLVNNKTYEDMRSKFEGLTSQLAASESEKQAVESQLSTLKAKTDDLFRIGVKHTLHEKSTVQVGGTLLNVGLTRVNVTGDAELNFNGTLRTVSAGDVFEVPTANGAPCDFRILYISYSGSMVEFTADCTKVLKKLQ